MDTSSPIRRKTSGERVGRPPVPGLDRFGPRVARLIEHRLRSVHGAPIECRFASLAMTKFGAMPPTGPTSSIAVAGLEDGEFAGFVEVEAALVSRLLELSLGLPVASADGGERPLTPVDQALARPFVEDVRACYSAAIDAAWGSPSASAVVFSRYLPSLTGLLEVEADNDFLETAIAVAFAPDAAPLTITIRTPLAALDGMRGAAPILDEPVIEPAPRDPRWGAAMRRAAAGADLRLVAVLRRMRMNLGEASEMRPGDIIPLSNDGGMNVELSLPGQNGAVISAGRLGAADDRRAVKITAPPQRELSDAVKSLLGV